jgi:hypothetical protein
VRPLGDGITHERREVQLNILRGSLDFEGDFALILLVSQVNADKEDKELCCRLSSSIWADRELLTIRQVYALCCSDCFRDSKPGVTFQEHLLDKIMIFQYSYTLV